MNTDPNFSITHSLTDLPLLPRGVTVRQFSSHNRAGYNKDDDEFLYTDDYGDSVLFDATGPGCVRSMWSTNIPADQVLLFYFDGESKPRYEIPSLQFYKGEHPLFPPPLNSYKKVGYYGENPFSGNSFTPIPFARSLKISVRGERCFHHILYEQYPHGTPVDTFTGREDHSTLLRAFSDGGEAFCPPELDTVVSEFSETGPREELILLDRGEPGTIRRITIEADGSDDFLSNVMLQVRWDGSRIMQVNCPIGHFFATPFQAENVQALPVSARKLEGGRVVLTSWFPMPFWGSAQIKLVNTSGIRLGTVRAEFSLEKAVPPRERSGYFCTYYHAGLTEYGRDWLFFSGPGAGWFVGVVQTMVGEHYCEGDEHFSLDRACSPQINGTGSEDYYLMCFWPNRHVTLPFAGSVGDVFQQGGGFYPGSYRFPGRYYRFHLEAPIPFYSHADLRIQHGRESDIRSNYTSLAFLYLSPTPVHHQTDYLKVTNTGSEAMHGYTTSQANETITVNSSCEGDELHFPHRDTGRVHAGGEIRFSVAIDPGNQGVRLRRRLDQAVGRQQADVFIDGEFAGAWYHADENPALRWFDSDFDIHPRYTRGKERLAVQLILGAGARFTDFSYEVYSAQ